ncbi:MAG: hypothetical protein AB7H92_03750 [Microbacteriaceae bacterium]
MGRPAAGSGGLPLRGHSARDGPVNPQGSAPELAEGLDRPGPALYTAPARQGGHGNNGTTAPDRTPAAGVPVSAA